MLHPIRSLFLTLRASSCKIIVIFTHSKFMLYINIHALTRGTTVTLWPTSQTTNQPSKEQSGYARSALCFDITSSHVYKSRQSDHAFERLSEFLLSEVIYHICDTVLLKASEIFYDGPLPQASPWPNHSCTQYTWFFNVTSLQQHCTIKLFNLYLR